MLPRRLKIRDASPANADIALKWLGRTPLVLSVNEQAGIVHVVDDKTGADNVCLPVAWFEQNDEFKTD